MRPPFIQIAEELFQAADDLGVILNWNAGEAFRGVASLIRWILARCPEDSPPSANAIVRGAAAAKLIANAAGYRGDPEAFAKACEECSCPILQRVEGGIRIRGLRRYDALWGKYNPAEWKAWKKAHPDYRTDPEQEGGEPAPEPAQNRPGLGPEQRRKDQDQDQVEDPKEGFRPPPPTPSGLAVVEDEEYFVPGRDGCPSRQTRPKVRWKPSVDGVWEMIQAWREVHRLPREAKRPRKFNAWAAEALNSAGPDALERTYRGFVTDETIEAKTYPTAIFIGNVWEVRRPAPDVHFEGELRMTEERSHHVLRLTRYEVLELEFNQQRFSFATEGT